MPEQLTLFDSLILQAANTPVQITKSAKADNTSTVQTKKVNKPTPAKLVPPQEIVDLLNSVHTIEDLSVKCNVPFSHEIKDNKIYGDINPDVRSKYSRQTDSWYRTSERLYFKNVVQIGPSNSSYSHKEEDTVNLLYVDADCNPWTAKIEISGDGIPFTCHVEKKKWQLATRLQVYSPVQDLEQIRTIMQEKMPYTVKYCDEVNGDLLTFLIAPQLEHLDKAGYVFARSFFKACSLKDNLTYQRYQRNQQDDLDKFNRLIVRTVTPGKIKNVFKTSAEVAKVLKDERKIEVWDTYRILDKFGRIKPDDIQQAYDAGLTPNDLRLINSILNKRYNNKPIFTFGTLMNYLGRIDMYEAIDKRDGLQILSDYLNMCSQLEVEPKVDGDSLKREHDIMARNLRNKRDEIMEKKMKDGCEYLKKYDYAEDVFFIRGIRSHADLLAEANMQHNCVAGYANSIVNRRSLIYVMREKAHPDKSLVTIELSPDGMQIRQKYLAYNRPIHNKAMSDFIDRWHEHVKAVNKGISQPMNIEYGQDDIKEPETENDIEL